MTKEANKEKRELLKLPKLDEAMFRSLSANKQKAMYTDKKLPHLQLGDLIQKDYACKNTPLS